MEGLSMTPFTDHDAAVMLCQAYEYAEYPSPFWDGKGASDDVRWNVKILPDSTIALVLPGTDVHNLADVLCDLDIVSEEPDFMQMGRVHTGFDHGLPSVISDVAARYRLATVNTLGAELRIIGHSLGAARGNLIHERMTCMRFNFDYEPVLFGEPRSTERVPLDAISYLNGADPIHGLPPYPYTGRPSYLKLSVKPPEGHRWGPLLGWHDMRLYEQGLR